MCFHTTAQLKALSTQKWPQIQYIIIILDAVQYDTIYGNIIPEKTNEASHLRTAFNLLITSLLTPGRFVFIFSVRAPKLRFHSCSATGGLWSLEVINSELNWGGKLLFPLRNCVSFSLFNTAYLWSFFFFCPSLNPVEIHLQLYISSCLFLQRLTSVKLFLSGTMMRLWKYCNSHTRLWKCLRFGFVYLFIDVAIQESFIL